MAPACERALHDDGIAVHGEDQNARARVVRIDAADQRQPAEPAALHGEVDDHHVGTMPVVEPVAGNGIARLEHGCDAGVLQHAPAGLQHDRVVVDDRGRWSCHRTASMPASAAAFAGSASGMVMRTQVPLPGALSDLVTAAQTFDALLHAADAETRRHAGIHSAAVVAHASVRAARQPPVRLEHRRLRALPAHGGWHWSGTPGCSDRSSGRSNRHSCAARCRRQSRTQSADIGARARARAGRASP